MPRNFDYPHALRGRMARSYLAQVVEDASTLQKALRDDDKLPAWVEYYVATTADRMQTASRYMQQEIANFQPSAYSDAYGDAAPGLRIPGVPGVYGDDKALILTRRMKVFLKQLRKKIGFDIVVTSGVRDLRDQAGAMYTKLKTYGYKSLVDLYPDELVAGMQNAGSADEVYRLLKQRVSSGMTVSRHLAGDAIDFRTRNLTTAQVSALKKAGEEMGAKVLWEEDHLHMQGFGSALPLWAWAGIGLAVAGAVAGGAWAVSRRVGR
jgi:hypothetical protein